MDEHMQFHLAIAALLAASLCQCSSAAEATTELDVPSPVAVGATVTVKEKCAGASCPSTLKLDQARVEDASVFRVEGAPPGAQVTSLRLEALRAGSTLFRVRTDDGQTVRTVERTLLAAVPDKLTFAVPACSAPLLFGTDHTFSLGVNRFVGSVPLQGSGGVYPLAAEGGGARRSDRALLQDQLSADEGLDPVSGQSGSGSLRGLRRRERHQHDPSIREEGAQDRRPVRGRQQAPGRQRSAVRGFLRANGYQRDAEYL